MSPKQITRTAVVVGGVSVIGLVMILVVQPAWGVLSWWPVFGLALALLLLVISFLRGAYLSAQKRVHMVDMLNDCYHSEVPKAD